MPLDPHLAGVLKMLADAGRKPTYLGTPEEGRAGYLALTIGTRKPEEIVPVGSIEDTTVDGATGPMKARIYRPEGAGPFPTVSYLHGGGYVIGNLDTHDNMCRDLCRGAQAVVVSLDYRLAPEHPFPAGIEDAVTGTRWVASRARELGGTDTVGVAGDSAGGNFSAVVSQQLRGTPHALAAQFLIYPAVDHLGAGHASLEENAKGYFLELETMKWFYAHYAGDRQDVTDPRIAPLQAASLAGLPPAVIVTAEFDPLRDEGEAYGRALQAAGVKAEVIRCDGMIHGFFDMGRWSPAAQAHVQGSIRRFAEVLRGG
ncbi:MAG: alpha/beta hydrolase [Burkholderiaceae bacterium]|jgi:acetyl esterase|nr:alpha/beta hydrolase [Burkholderiaceae bacterium]